MALLNNTLHMKYLLIILMSLGALNLSAQHRKHDRPSGEKLEAQKVAFFTQKLDLSPEEAQVFWPVYNEYSKQKKEFREKRMPRIDPEEIDDTQATEMLSQHFKNKELSLALDKEYAEKFSKVLAPKKVLMLFVLERRFKEEVLKDLKKRLDHKH